MLISVFLTSPRHPVTKLAPGNNNQGCRGSKQVVLTQRNPWLDGGRGTSDNMRAKGAWWPRPRPYRGAVGPQWKAHSSSGRDFPKALIRNWTLGRVLKGVRDLQGQGRLPQQRKSGASALKSDRQGVSRRGGTGLASITGLSEPQRKVRKQRQEMLGVSRTFGSSRESLLCTVNLMWNFFPP